MKKIYKIFIIIVFILIIGNLMYFFNWSRDMLKGYWIGNVVGMLIGFMVAWLVGFGAKKGEIRLRRKGK